MYEDEIKRLDEKLKASLTKEPIPRDQRVKERKVEDYRPKFVTVDFTDADIEALGLEVDEEIEE